MVIKKDITLDLVALGKEFDFEKNRVKREAYRANHTKEQKVEVLEKWQEFMKEISSNVHFFEYFENILSGIKSLMSSLKPTRLRKTTRMLSDPAIHLWKT